jgi:hypothetical protein
MVSLDRFGVVDVQRPESVGEWLSWLTAASPVVPLVLGLRAHKQLRQAILANKGMEKLE